MRRTTSMLLLLATCMWLPQKAASIADEPPRLQSKVVVGKALNQWGGVEINPLQTVERKPSMDKVKPIATKSKVKPLLKARQKSKPASTGDLSGEYVQTYESILNNGYNGGLSVKIEPVTGASDSIKIVNFFDNGIEIKAKVDFSASTISIPNQFAYKSETYGDVDIAVVVNQDGFVVPDRKQDIKGIINDDGTIAIDTWWGVFVKSGEYADRYFGAYGNTLIEKSNGTMSQTVLSKGQLTKTTYNIVAAQTAPNLVTVRNFANFGHTVDFVLNSDNTSTIPSQLVWQHSSYGDFYTKAITYDTEKEELTGNTNDIKTSAATDKRTLSWKDWSFISGKAFYAIFTEGEVKTGFDISYPETAASEFTGDGTEQSPYLISKIEDLALMSEKANGIPESEFDGQENNSKYARAFAGKYFRLENDIDMKGYRFTPIGNDWYHRFAGTFDGNGHSINNIDISSGTGNYAGLFGRLEEAGVVKNLSMDRPVVKSQGNAIGVIAGDSRGLIDNCHVANANVYTGGQAVGGIAGVASTVTRSTVTDSKIKGMNGYVAGIAGEIDKLVEDCHVVSTDITMYSPNSGYPAGGIVGSLYEATARNCYFAGKVDAYTTITQGAFLGGIAGSCSLGSIEKCFSVGNVLGYGNETASGGIVGVLHGSVSDSYSIGRIQNTASRRTGGITGYIGAYEQPEDTPKQSSVKSSYTATAIVAETYRYNPETEARETLGQIQENSSPEISNVYFDKKITNLTSTRYGVETAVLTAASGVVGLDANVWNFTEGQYPRLKGLDNNETASLGASAVLTPTGSSFNKLAADAELKPLSETEFLLLNNGNLGKEGHFCKIADGKLKINNDFGTDTLFIRNGNTQIYYFVKVAPIPFEGEGTELNPYLLKTKADLVKLSEVTTNDKQQFPETYFRMTNDIDLESDQAFLGISMSDIENQFEGNFDGGGFTVHGLYQERIQWVVRPEDDPEWGGKPESKYDLYCGGFIGILASKGVVKNLNIADDCQFLTWASTGAIVGENYGTVDNCKNYSEVRCYGSWVGGIVGQNYRGGKVLNCYNEGSVYSGFTTAGGIVGANYGTIENSANAGDITVKILSQLRKNGKTLRLAGGIAGTNSNSKIKNVVNAGNVYAYTGKAGGITGSLPESFDETGDGRNDLANAINYGMVSTVREKTYGSINGSEVSKGTISDNYYDTQISLWKANANDDKEGMFGVETSMLTSGTALKNFDTELWDFSKGMYPVLKQFATEPKLAKARKAIVEMKSGVTAKDMSQNATLAKEDGLSWTLKQGKDFAIGGRNLYAPEDVDDLVIDTLVANYGDYTKQIEIRRLPNVPLQGAGTEENPYLISAATDWNNTADYMQKIGETFEGKFLKVTDNFAFGETAFKVLGTSDTPLQATLDGDGKTIGGIKYTSSESYDGAIRAIGKKATVKNLTLKGDIDTEKFYIGGFAGEIYGSLVNCTNEINVTCDDDGASGFGKIYGSASLTDCTNKATITATGEGLAGFAYMMEEPEGEEIGAQFIRCINEGKIVNNGKDQYTAGLIAKAYPCRLEECANKGVIEISDPANTKSVAGLIAYAQSADSYKYELVRCYNEADITAGSIVAGLIASTKSSSSSNSPFLLTECYNTGDITSASTKAVSKSPTAGLTAFYNPGSVYSDCYNTGKIESPKNNYIAGIAGYYLNQPAKDTPVSFNECHNEGKIVANGEQGGGITAYSRGYMAFDNCHNTGDIEGAYNLGGITGYIGSSDVAITNSWNSGNVTNSMSKTGGITGGGSANARIENCFNIGNISTTSTEGGTSYKNGYAVGGIAGESGAIITNCYNMGEVKGASQVGGIVGTPVKNFTQIIRSYNAGKIVAEADTCGALIGADLSNGRVWTADNKVEGCYYVTDNGETGNNNSVGTGFTTAELAKADMGDGWTNGDDYTMPIPATMVAVPQALVNAVTVAFSDGDTKDKVTRDFFVGAPEGIAWTASVPDITFSGTAAKFGTAAFKGDIVLTATAGELSRTFEISCDKADSGVDGIASGKTVVGEVWYNASGIRIPKPTSHDGAVYLVIRTYDDGSIETLKVFNTK